MIDFLPPAWHSQTAGLFSLVLIIALIILLWWDWRNNLELRAENRELLHHLKRLDKNRNDYSLVGQRLSLEKGLGESNFPALLVDQKGKIIWSNHKFWTLIGRQKVSSLSDFDKVCGSFLQKVYDHQNAQVNPTIKVKPYQKVNEWQAFEVFAWKINLNSLKYTGIILIEQEHHAIHHLVRSQFQHQLISYLKSIANELVLFHRRSRSQNDPKLKSLTEEVNMLGEYLEQTQLLIGHQDPAERVDMGRVTHQALNEIKQVFSDKHLHLALTLPYRKYVHGHSADFKLGINTLLDAVFSLAAPKQEVRVHLGSTSTETVLTITIPGLVLSSDLIKKARHFGAKDEDLNTVDRFWRLQIALTQQILAKYRGKVSIFSEKKMGTVFELTCATFDTV